MKSLCLTLLLLTLTILRAPAAPTCCKTNLPATAPVTDASLYQIDTTWTSDHNKPVQLSQLRGQVQIVTMFFASCQYACPILVHDMKKIDAGLAAAGITNVGFILVTIDPERDTVEALHTFREQRRLDDRWLLLRSSDPQDILELAALLGIKYKKEPTGQYAHSNLITLLNQNGEIAHQQPGLNTDPAPMIATIRTLLTSSKTPDAP
jgi:protein SCO1